MPLPQPTTDLEQQKADLDEFGYCIVADALSPDEATTLKIAEEISKRFTEIEENSARIDTLAFALFTAFSYATEKHELEAQQDEDNRSMVKALDSITSRLDELTERFGVGDEE